MPSDATQIALHMRRLEQRIAALERKETGSGGGGGGLDFDDIDSLSPIASLALDDTLAVYDESASAAGKVTVQGVWDSIVKLDPTIATSFSAYVPLYISSATKTFRISFDNVYTLISSLDDLPFTLDPDTDYFVISSATYAHRVTLNDIFDAIKTIDGTGSGLDADLLDGLDSTAFAAASHNHSASDITSGTIDDARIPSGIARDSEVAASYSPLGHSHSASDITSGMIDNARLHMGSGGGLDADTVDGGHFSEGTWTPSLTFGGGSTGMTYETNAHGRYTRIGNSVFFAIRFNLTAKGSSTGDATVSLPITATSAATNMVWMCTGFGANLSLTTNAVFSPAIVVGGTAVLLGQQVGGSNRTSLTHAHFANNSQIRISGYYEV